MEKANDLQEDLYKQVTHSKKCYLICDQGNESISPSDCNCGGIDILHNAVNELSLYLDSIGFYVKYCGIVTEKMGESEQYNGGNLFDCEYTEDFGKNGNKYFELPTGKFIKISYSY